MVSTPRSPPSSVDQYRVALLLSRWGRRTHELLLQCRATALGRDLLLHDAFVHLRRYRTACLHRWHREKSAELHRWRALMRLVVRAWRGWYAILAETAARRDAALIRRADRLCAWCLGGWVLYVRQRWHERAALIHRADTLQQRCLNAWAVWVAARLRKRPERERLARVAATRALQMAWPRWVATADRRAAALLESAMAALLANEKRAEHAVATWAAYRLRAARRATQLRRAYLFMGTRLLTRVAGAWRGALTASRTPALLHPTRPPPFCNVIAWAGH